MNADDANDKALWQSSNPGIMDFAFEIVSGDGQRMTENQPCE